jgi:hypothetical protein
MKASRRLKIDSSPQQATVYWDVVAPGAPSDPRGYGVAGYTPVTLKVPRGTVKVIVELRGFRPVERELDRKTRTMTFTLERAPEAGKLDLRAGRDGAAAGAEVIVDGVSRGTIPNVFEIASGRHQLEVKKQGYETHSEWLEVREGELRTLDLSLKPDGSGGGSIMVVADQGEVYLDGERKDDAPTVITGVKPGEHVIELRPPGGGTPWRQTVTIEAGKQVKVNPSGVGATGGLRVLANEQDVEIFLDGKPVGRAPAELPAVPAGQHVIEGRKPGFKSTEEAIKLTPGEQMLVRLKLEPSLETPKGMLRVQSPVPNAEVFLDGASLGNAPIDRKDLEPGKHFVTVTKPGFREFKREVVLVENKPVVVVAELESVSAVKFLSEPQGATVFIDGEPLPGVTPTSRSNVPAGEHQIMFRKKGYIDLRQTVKIEGGKERIVHADLEVIPTGPTREEVYTYKKGMSSFGARTLPPGSFTADLGVGYPYWLTTRLTVAAYRGKYLTTDAGVSMKTYLSMWEFGVHGRGQFMEVGPLSLAAFTEVGGGAGFNGRDTFYFEVGPIASLSFNNIVTFSVHSFYQLYSDQVCPTKSATEKRDVQPRQECLDWMAWRFSGRKDPVENRFTASRVFLGGSLEVAIDRYFSVFAVLNFLPFQYKSRAAFRDEVNSIMFEQDSLAYGMLGGTLKL